MTQLLDLSDDVLLNIFSLLDAISLCKVRRVCRRFHDLATDEILWKHKLLNDVKQWKWISHDSLPSGQLQKEHQSLNKDMYLKASPDVLQWKKQHYQQSTLHQMTQFLKGFMPAKRYLVGVDASVTDNFGRGQSFLGKLLAFDSANIFHHCGEFPGRFRGRGGGFQFKYKNSMLDLSLMYIAPKNERASMSVERKAELQEIVMKGLVHRELYAAFDGYIHTVDARILQNQTAAQAEANMASQARELQIIDKHLHPLTPLLVLCCKVVESDASLPSYTVTKALNLQQLNRPWMVSDCSMQMIYRDMEDPTDWLLRNVKLNRSQ